MTQLASFEDSVKERLKGIVADLIPEERWDEIVHATVRSFETHDLPKLIKAELEAQYKKAIQAEFAKPEWQSKWNNGTQEASVAVQKLIMEAAPTILASMIGGAMQGITQQFQYALQQTRGY